MTSEPRQLQSIFPDVPRETPETDGQGNFTALWSLFFGALSQALQDNFSNEGILFPSLSATNIATIQAIYAPYIGLPLPSTIPDISGKTVFDSTNRVPKQFIITYDASSPSIILSASWLQLNVMLTGIGDPNGYYNITPPHTGSFASVAGVLNWLYYDLTGTTLYICTSNGAAIIPSPGSGAAVWTAI